MRRRQSSTITFSLVGAGPCRIVLLIGVLLAAWGCGALDRRLASRPVRNPFPRAGIRDSLSSSAPRHVRYEGRIAPPPSVLPGWEPEFVPEPGEPEEQESNWHRDIVATSFDLLRKRNPRTAWNEGRPLLINPYHVALPFNDRLPGHEEYGPCQGRWVEIVNPETGRRVYAQWEDVGPWFVNDAEYVFDETGTVRPLAEKCIGKRLNIYGETRRRQGGRRLRRVRNAAGIDLSPWVTRSLGITGKAFVNWRFVDEEEVPDGPWKQNVP